MAEPRPLGAVVSTGAELSMAGCSTKFLHLTRGEGLPFMPWAPEGQAAHQQGECGNGCLLGQLARYKQYWSFSIPVV